MTVKKPTPGWQWILVAVLVSVVIALAGGCTYDVVVVKNVGPGCSSTAALQAETDIDASATGTAAGGSGEFMNRLARAIATDDACPTEPPSPGQSPASPPR